MAKDQKHILHILTAFKGHFTKDYLISLEFQLLTLTSLYVDIVCYYMTFSNTKDLQRQVCGCSELK